MYKIVVNNALSREVDRLFRSNIRNRQVLQKNRIEYTIDVDGVKNLFWYFANRFHVRAEKI